MNISAHVHGLPFETIEKMQKNQLHRFSVAPMMEWTDRHCRFFLRLISRHARLYTEMVASSAVVHGDRNRLLKFDPSEHPVALQLGGSDPNELAQAARIGADFGYDEINLNIGCPSDRVRAGRFGACLMAEPELVAECIATMSAAVDVPVTVKCRIGIDNQDEEQTLTHFVETVMGAGANTFVIHARKAWLDGLSPKQNRDIPPLNYARVYRLKQTFPELKIILNGGIENLDEAENHLRKVDGVMIGRAAYHNPYMLAGTDQRFFGAAENPLTRFEVIERLIPYIDAKLAGGVRLHQITRHILGLFQGQSGARAWRRHLSEEGTKPDAGSDVLKQALLKVSKYQDMTPPIAAE